MRDFCFVFFLFLWPDMTGTAAQRGLLRGRGDQQQDPQQEGSGGSYGQVQLHPRGGRGGGGTYVCTFEDLFKSYSLISVTFRFVFFILFVGYFFVL